MALEMHSYKDPITKKTQLIMGDGEPTPKKYVYIVATEKELKIGYSSNPVKRMACMQTGNPKKLHLVTTLNHEDYSAQELEKLLHIAFYKERLEGEWFKISVIKDLFFAFKKDFDKIYTVSAITPYSLSLGFKKHAKRNPESLVFIF